MARQSRLSLRTSRRVKQSGGAAGERLIMPYAINQPALVLKLSPRQVARNPGIGAAGDGGTLPR